MTLQNEFVQWAVIAGAGAIAAAMVFLLGGGSGACVVLGGVLKLGGC